MIDFFIAFFFKYFSEEKFIDVQKSMTLITMKQFHLLQLIFKLFTLKTAVNYMLLKLFTAVHGDLTTLFIEGTHKFQLYVRY